jgi:hypothetical protein
MDVAYGVFNGVAGLYHNSSLWLLLSLHFCCWVASHGGRAQKRQISKTSQTAGGAQIDTTTVENSLVAYLLKLNIWQFPAQFHPQETPTPCPARTNTAADTTRMCKTALPTTAEVWNQPESG